MTSIELKPFELLIFKSNQHIYAQIIDTNNSLGHIILSSSTVEKSYKLNFKNLSQVEDAKKIGMILGKRAIDLGITRLIVRLKKNKFSNKKRKNYQFHGKIKALVLEIVNSGISIKKN